LASKKVGIGICTIVMAIIGIFASGEGTNWTFDFSTNIDQSTTIGDIITSTVNNYVVNNLGIDLEQFKENCDAGIYEGREAQGYCDLVK